MYVGHSDDERSWFQARQFCQLLGGDLAIIRSASAHYAVRQWLETRPAYKTRTWVGLAKTVWYWTTGRNTFVVSQADMCKTAGFDIPVLNLAWPNYVF